MQETIKLELSLADARALLALLETSPAWDETTRDLRERVFLALGRMGGNTIGSPHRLEWERLRDMIQWSNQEAD